MQGSKLKFLFLWILLLFIVTNSNADPIKQWTMLIYINGNNNLDLYAIDNIKEMESVGSTDETNVVVQWASLSSRTTKRLLLEKSTDPSTITSPILEDLGLIDMGDYHPLQDFIKWGITHYPAEHYFLVVWNHGNGWKKQLQLLKQNQFSDISYDEISGNAITTEQLGQVMQYTAELIGHKLDIYASDACLMAMIEVANEMANTVHYFIGSQEVEPATGWPYKNFLQLWQKNTHLSAPQVAQLLVDSYKNAYSKEEDWSFTLSAYDLSQFSQLNSVLKQLVANIQQLSFDEKEKVFTLATVKTERFYMDDYADLMDFINHLANTEILGLDKLLLAEIKKAANAFIIANGVAGLSPKRAYGLSVWLPVGANVHNYTKNLERYKKMSFHQNTDWGDLINFLVEGH